MSAIKGKNTNPELLVRKFLFGHGFRYRLNHPRLLGHPDLVLRKYNRRQNQDINKVRFKKYYELCLKEIKNEEKAGMTHTHGFNIATHGTFWNSGLRGYIEKYVGTGRYYLITEA